MHPLVDWVLHVICGGGCMHPLVDWVLHVICGGGCMHPLVDWVRHHALAPLSGTFQ
jgi:hypothetical protein